MYVVPDSVQRRKTSLPSHFVEKLHLFDFNHKSLVCIVMTKWCKIPLKDVSYTVQQLQVTQVQVVNVRVTMSRMTRKLDCDLPYEVPDGSGHDFAEI